MLSPQFDLSYLLSRYRLKIVFLLIFSVIFIAMRLINLTLLPPYVDELFHISRAFNVLEERQPFVYTEGGKFLQIWLITPALALGGDPLWTARAVSVLVSLLSAVGCYSLGRILFGQREIGLAAAGFYLVIPYAFFLDRLALNDSMLGTLAIYIMLLSIKLVQHRNLWSSLGLGLILGLAGLTKLNGGVLWVIPLLVILFWSDRQSNKPWRYLLPAYLLAIVMTSPVFLILSRQLDGPATKTWLLAAPTPGSFLGLWLSNVGRIWLYFQTYLTWPVFIMALIGTVLTLFHRHRGGLLLISAALIYSAVFDITTVFIPSRYLFAVVPFVLILAGYGLVTIGNSLLRTVRQIRPSLPMQNAWVAIGVQLVLIILLALPAFGFNYQLLVDPTQVPFEASDRWLFVDGWTSGYGLNDVTNFLREEAARQGYLVVVRQDASGLTREGLEINLADMADSIKLVKFDFTVEPPQRLTKLLEESEGYPVFVVLRLPLAPGAIPYRVDFDRTPYCHRAVTYYKPDHYNYVGVYECSAANLVDSE